MKSDSKIQPRIFGFSAGFGRSTLSIFDRLDIIANAGCSAVEIWLEHFQPGEFDRLSSQHLAAFKWVSLHAPKHGFQPNDPETAKIFRQIERLNQIRRLDMVVVHPDPIEDFSVFKNVDFQVGIENMDNHKPWGQKPGEIANVLAKNDQFKMVLDLNHIYVNDSSMKLAQEFYNQFGNKIGEIHLSGYTKLHDPLFETKQAQIIQAIQNFDTPIIIESPVSPQTINLEKDYILNEINQLKIKRYGTS